MWWRWSCCSSSFYDLPSCVASDLASAGKWYRIGCCGDRADYVCPFRTPLRSSEGNGSSNVGYGCGRWSNIAVTSELRDGVCTHIISSFTATIRRSASYHLPAEARSEAQIIKGRRTTPPLPPPDRMAKLSPPPLAPPPLLDRTAFEVTER